MVKQSRRHIVGASKPRPHPEPGPAPVVLRTVGEHAQNVADLLSVTLLMGPRPNVVVVPGEASGDAEPQPAELVVLLRAEYEALRREEDDDEAGALAAYKRSRTAERVPAAVVDRLLVGEHPVRVWREHRKLTLEQLRDKAGLSIGYLSEIEAGKKPGSLKALRAVAAALGIELDDVTAWLRR